MPGFPVNYQKLEQNYLSPIQIQRDNERVDEYLERKNAQFKRLSKEKQRVQVAKDVLKWLEIGKIRPASTYFRFHDFINVPGKRKIDLSVATSQVRCDVCGIGAIFLAVVERNDKFKFQNHVERHQMVSYLEPWFDARQLDLIEAFFELGAAVPYGHPILYRRGGGEHMKRERLTRIMLNIISNKGEFNPRKGKYGRNY